MWIFLILAALLGVAVLWLYQSESLLLLEDVAAGAGPSRLKQRVGEPSRTTVHYQTLGQEYDADLYRPAETARAGIVLVPGAAERGKDDPRLVAFANSLARARFVVFVPTLPDVQHLRLRPGNARELAAAFTQFIHLSRLDVDRPMGIGAFSYAAGPAILAALDEEVREQVDFVVTVGGYYDIDQVMRFMTTGEFEVDGKREYLKPRPYGRLVFAMSHMEFLGEGDQKIIQQFIERYKQDPDTQLDDLAPQLDTDGRAVYEFLQNRDPARVPQLIQALPPGIRHNMEALNLANYDLSRLRAKLILIHGRYDDMIPYSQSLALRDAAPRADAFIVAGLEHVDIPPGIRDRYTMWRAIRDILRVRDGRSIRSVEQSNRQTKQ
jgi:hypothetical protein